MPEADLQNGPRLRELEEFDGAVVGGCGVSDHGRPMIRPSAPAGWPDWRERIRLTVFGLREVRGSVSAVCLVVMTGLR